MAFTEQQIQALAPNPAAFVAGKKLSSKEQWQSFARSERAIWGAIKGSGSSPYLAQVDLLSPAYKCTCPSRQFPCKHTIALMLLYTGAHSSFQEAQEPEWVSTWMDKRLAKEKENEKESASPKSAEELAQLEKNREKTQVNRIASVKAGAEELELWLRDLVRIGLLDLPWKKKTEFDRVAARMVDAKAPGLAGWVKALAKLNYEDQNEWHRGAMTILAKLFLLVRAIKNIDNLDPLWQQTIRNLSGWSQSTKELLADNEAPTVRDHWLVAGQETELTDDDITVQRNWLIGCTSNTQALILNFGTRLSALENTIIPGTILEAELAFFPSVWPQRGAVKLQRKVVNKLESKPQVFASWNEVQRYKGQQVKIYPWVNDLVIILQEARLARNEAKWFVVDNDHYFIPVVPDFDFAKIMRWLALSGNRKLDMALVLRNNNAVPLGVIEGDLYKLF